MLAKYMESAVSQYSWWVNTVDPNSKSTCTRVEIKLPTEYGSQLLLGLLSSR